MAGEGARAARTKRLRQVGTKVLSVLDRRRPTKDGRKGLDDQRAWRRLHRASCASSGPKINHV